MSNEARYQVVTKEQRQWLHDARRRGEVCASCGRDLAAGESVWQEGFTISGSGTAMYQAPVGVECVSPDFEALTRDVEPERCAGCGRGVHYSPDLHQRGYKRKQALCSRRCGGRATVANRQKRAKAEGSTQ
jgi:hypothetical protein